MINTGLRISSVVTDALLQASFVKPNTPYAELQAFAYGLFDSLAERQIKDDWLETANGTTYTLTFKP